MAGSPFLKYGQRGVAPAFIAGGAMLNREATLIRSQSTGALRFKLSLLFIIADPFAAWIALRQGSAERGNPAALRRWHGCQIL